MGYAFLVVLQPRFVHRHVNGPFKNQIIKHCPQYLSLCSSFIPIKGSSLYSHCQLLFSIGAFRGSFQTRITAFVSDNIHEQIFLDFIEEVNLATNGKDNTGFKDTCRLSLKVENTGINNFYGKGKLFSLVIDEYLIVIANGRLIIGYEIETAQGDIFDDEFLIAWKPPGQFVYASEISADFTDSIKANVLPFFKHDKAPVRL